MNDAFELQRFVDAQEPVIDAVRGELRGGRKRSHWMWFVFPQLAGLGRSAMAQRYSIASLAEARAYLAHPLLGPRLRECGALVLAVEGRDIHEIFGAPDDLKFWSCMTLFDAADPSEPVFRDCLHKYFGSRRDGQTLARIEGGDGG
ncbi:MULTISPECIES: DUF1810 domain-containing protein [unclassified Variovorax]|uniref:DUF1810 domain-containing protein n=1 Tax=unclassified Variovorax TaxID=663243 RepID=UPI00076CC4B7|nr:MULTISPECIES: DUF1810 domain-containing protein [unclassified Variovorax]KWT98830.1 NTP pyrophosphohydrolase [Variovorax sp. WDL1]PNG56106.1 hypothetical protein CHC07_02520 [Variovorax sp. B4]PNG57530.1 hypothetical protein CHC06_02523 [Variovorax sp. B2]VTV10076.1 hypothetical protein WDL1CHR_01107 [Variovorax sp. WDL1]